MNSVLVKIPYKYSLLISFPLLMGVILWFSILVENILIAFFAICIIPISIKLAYLFSFKEVKVDFFDEEIHFSFLNRLNKKKQEFEVRKDEIHSFSFDSRNAANLFWLKIKEGKKIKINTLDFYPIIPKDYYQFKKHFEEFIEHNKVINQRKEVNPDLYVGFILVFFILGTVLLVYNLINS